MVKVSDYDLSKVPQVDIVRKYNPHTKSVQEYLNVEMSFDIETTSMLLNDTDKFAFMYEWTFGIHDRNYICYGRTWEQFIKLCDDLHSFYNLSDNRRCIIYVHNLGYEFQFMRKFFNWVNVFSVDDRKPIKALCDKGIEFRDSYILSGYNLAKTAENLTSHKIKKLLGDLDYKLVRTSETYLSPEELAYCNNDVEIVLDYINEQITQYGDITKVPLTNTGRVRSFVKDKCYRNKVGKKTKSQRARYIDLMSKLTLTPDIYMMLKQAFMGGFTHSSMKYTGYNENLAPLKNVSSIDFTSSYPYTMLSEKFPMSKAIPVNMQEGKFMDYYKSPNIGLLFECKLIGVHSKNTYESYLSESKCYRCKGLITNNGRIFQADEVTTTITDIDLKIILSCYEVEHIEISNCYRFILDYLPRPIITSILELYKNKTQLKNVEGKEVEYLLSKGMLNSVYGMCVTDIVRDEIIYNAENDLWEIEKLNTESRAEQIEKYNTSKNRFLYYPWGVWVTAWSREHLWQGINAIGDDYIYSDTDSIKFLNYDKHKEWIAEYNKECDNKLRAMCEFYDIDFLETRPKTIKGVEKPIGYFDYEGTYDYFKTLGAKRYMYSKNGKVYITVAGLSKAHGVEYLENKYHGDIQKIFQAFNDDLYIPKEATGKNTHTYIDNVMESDVVDYTGLKSHVISPSSIHLSECDFTLSQTDIYIKFLNNLQNGYLYIGGTRKV